MTRRLIASGSTFETEVAYSRAVVDGDWVFVAGTTGFDHSTMSISEDVVEQTEQAFRNIEAALRQAGSALRDVVRVTYILPDAKEFPRCWPVLRKYFGDGARGRHVRLNALVLTVYCPKSLTTQIPALVGGPVELRLILSDLCCIVYVLVYV
jgi:enamine deaminase RidA (YjgF/YER057c/UK114 family)